MTKYLYGASVQGIQDFIFRTNKLREIVGASEIVKQICTEDFFTISHIEKTSSNLIMAAAGSVKCIFDENEKDKLEIVVKTFSKMVTTKAPGITISQSVVKFENDNIAEALQTLENNLKVQRNMQAMPYEVGFMGIERARRTGGLGIIYNKSEVRDKATQSKLDNSETLKLVCITYCTKLQI